jgi:hypothetical protein
VVSSVVTRAASDSPVIRTASHLLCDPSRVPFDHTIVIV